MRRDELRKRDDLDRRVEAEHLRGTTPGERLAMSLELSSIARALARSTHAKWLRVPIDLAIKARSRPRMT